jgi:cyclin-dependent kinase 7
MSQKRRLKAESSGDNDNKRAKTESVLDIEKIHEKYEKGKELGEGTFGKVYEGVVKATRERVAIKKIKVQLGYRDGLHPTALREIKYLREISQKPHENIIKMYDAYQRGSSLYLVFEYCLNDLERIIKDEKTQLPPCDIKSYMRMLLSGVAYCHKHFLLHRDLKPNNLMIGSDYRLKLIDFGLAKSYASPFRRYKSEVVTLWYRSPELLYGAVEYGPSLDMWSVGCIFGELLQRAPLFPGQREIQQLGMIFRLLGTPTEKEWPGMTSLPSYIEYTMLSGAGLENNFATAASVTSGAIDLLSKCLTYDPVKRISAEDALKHEYFTSKKPVPAQVMDLVAVKQLKSRATSSNLSSNNNNTAVSPSSSSSNTKSIAPIAKQLTF